YWLWMLILFSFVIQAVSYEYRSKLGNVYGSQFYDVLLFINGVVGPLLLGVAVAGMFFGAEFTVAKANIISETGPATISQWGPLHGLEAIACWKNLVFGLMVLFLARTLASLYFINNIDDEEIHRVQHRQLLVNGAIFVVFFLASAALILTASGVHAGEGVAPEWVEYKYLSNFISMWWCLAVFLIGTLLVLFGIIKSLLVKEFRRGIWFAGAGTILVVMALFWVLGYNDTAYYPSLLSVESSLTIRNSSSSHFTLTAMSIVSVLVPFVLAYIFYAWRAMDRKSLTTDELKALDEDDKY
ncbi:MAG: cytochrome d ubiquinol oxidase subunit II, partial [Muribaculaceae bacterium]|nr:cytochrome d ubiquinol oxidase subunit II [Muribaculaceae bacterium]